MMKKTILLFAVCLAFVACHKDVNSGKSSVNSANSNIEQKSDSDSIAVTDVATTIPAPTGDVKKDIKAVGDYYTALFASAKNTQELEAMKVKLKEFDSVYGKYCSDNQKYGEAFIAEVQNQGFNPETIFNKRSALLQGK